jgi:hypothetical protein
MLPFFLHFLSKSLNGLPDKDMLVTTHDHPHDAAEGSEFLDDALRMKDQPLHYTEHIIADTCETHL